MAQNKSNDATPLRSEGDRVLNAPLVEINWEKFIEQLKSEITWKDGDKNTITIFKSEKMRIVIIGLKANSELKKHTAPGFISVQPLKGFIRFKTHPDEGEQQISEMKPGQMIALQPKVPHSVEAVEESFFLLTLSML